MHVISKEIDVGERQGTGNKGRGRMGQSEETHYLEQSMPKKTYENATVNHGFVKLLKNLKKNYNSENL